MITWLANPHRFLRFAQYASPIFGALAIILISWGTYQGLINSPAERYQGDSVRIMYVHVPSAWLAMGGYAAIAIASLVAFVWRHPLAYCVARSCAVPGLLFTGLALITGSLWGSQTWMTWWVWDGRMTSTLVLFFIYLGYIAIWNVFENKQLAANIAGIVAIVGAINLPIIKYSVDWWDDVLHQESTYKIFSESQATSDFGFPLLLMFLGFSFFFGWVVINLIREDIARSRAKAARKTSAPSASATLKSLED